MIFVFGSNLDGRHGAGAALYAAKHCGAEYGIGEGLTGQSYALPTVGHNLARMPLADVCAAIERFCAYAKARPDLTFALTPVGCGLAGHNKKDIWAAFERAGLPKNVYLTSTWVTE